MIKHILLMLFCLMGVSAFAQNTDTPVDGYLQSVLTNGKPVPFPDVRQSDIYSVKRIWRDIDLKDKRNKFFGAAESRLIDVILKGIDNGKILAYDATASSVDPDGDSFKVKLKSGDAKNKFVGDSTLVDKIDSQTGDKIGSKMEANAFNPDSVTKFRIKEDWIFDKQRGIYEPRIIGIAPLRKVKVGEELVSEQPAFWIYFPQARNIFVNNRAMVGGNITLSYDDIFVMRKFYGKIIKESNPEDLRIKDYTKNQAEADQEADRIENELKGFKKRIYSQAK